jgi:hypothetical protein
VVAQIGQDADRLLGGKPMGCLIIDESSFAKQGDRSVGVARQWSGRLGKVDNCQVAVFAVLTDGQRHAPVDMRLYLPRVWIEDPARCDEAGVPAAARKLTAKSEHVLDIVRQARARGMWFNWVGIDAGYGKEPAFLRTLDDTNEVFVADIYSTQRVWATQPGPRSSAKARSRGPTPQRQASAGSITVEARVKSFWCGRLDALHPARPAVAGWNLAQRRAWLWDGEGAAPRCWHLIVRRRSEGRRKPSNIPCPMHRSRRRSCCWGRCKGSAIGSSARLKMPRVSVVWRTIRCWAGGPGTTTRQW